MNTRIDTLRHLPNVNAGPWKHFRGCYERYVSFNCEHRERHHAVLSVYGNGECDPMISIMIDNYTRTFWVGEHTDPFNIANEMLVTLSRNCDCHNETDGESL